MRCFYCIAICMFLFLDLLLFSSCVRDEEKKGNEGTQMSDSTAVTDPLGESLWEEFRDFFENEDSVELPDDYFD